MAALESSIRGEFSTYRRVEKVKSRLMRVLNFLLVVVTFGRMNRFMTDFITTVGYTVYTPTTWPSWVLNDKLAFLRHERIHMRQARRYGRVLFGALYLFFPVPGLFAWARMKFEREAYRETLRAFYGYYGADFLRDPACRASIIAHFTSAQYLWMWRWGRNGRWYDGVVAELDRHGHRA